MRDPQEDDMVRHEAAEALGGIASEGQPGTFDSPEDEERGVLQILRDWAVKSDAPPVVRESCQVAVDMWEYENSNQFQYADGLTAGAKAGEDGEGEAGKQRLTGMDRGINVAALSV
jgi:deoxyhypusine monooxygenase